MPNIIQRLFSGIAKVFPLRLNGTLSEVKAELALSEFYRSCANLQTEVLAERVVELRQENNIFSADNRRLEKALDDAQEHARHLRSRLAASIYDTSKAPLPVAPKVSVENHWPLGPGGATRLVVQVPPLAYSYVFSQHASGLYGSKEILLAAIADQAAASYASAVREAILNAQ